MINRERIFCGIDLGCRQIKAAVVKIKKGGFFDLLGLQELATQGLKKSSVTDLSELTAAIQSALKGLGKKSGVKFKDIQLGIGGHLIEPRYSRAIIPIAEKISKVITHSDIKKVNRQAQLLGIKIEEEIIHDFPQSYIVDDLNKALNPLGLYGRKLAINSLLMIAHVNLLSNLVKAVDQAGFQVANIFFATLAASEVCLDEELKRQGTLLVDLGAGTTNILFFKDGILRQVDIIPFGGDQLTEAIAEMLNLSFDLTEGIKKSHAAVIGEDNSSASDILIKKNDGYHSVKKKIICDAIKPEVDKLVERLKSILKFSHIEDKLGGGIVMIGGGSLLPGLIERVEKTTGLSVQLGKINLGSVHLSNAPLWASTIGLVQRGAHMSYNNNVLSSTSEQGWFLRAKNRIKEVYQEYF